MGRKQQKKDVMEMTDAELHDHLYYKNGKLKRRRTTEQERHKPCIWCEYPFSQRHHLLPIYTTGETEAVINLCANCHELYHITERSRRGNKAATKLLARFILAFGDDKRLTYAHQYCKMVEDIEKREESK